MLGEWLGHLSIPSMDQSALRQPRPRLEFRYRKRSDCEFLRTGKWPIGLAIKCIYGVIDSRPSRNVRVSDKSDRGLDASRHVLFGILLIHASARNE